MKEWIRNSSFSHKDTKEAEKLATIVFSVAVGIFYVGGMTGALLTEVTLNYVGLKWGIIASNIFVVVGSVLMGLFHFMPLLFI